MKQFALIQINTDESNCQTSKCLGTFRDHAAANEAMQRELDEALDNEGYDEYDDTEASHFWYNLSDVRVDFHIIELC